MTPEVWQKISAELDRLSDLSPADRTKALQKLAAQDPDLHKEVLSLLKQNPTERLAGAPSTLLSALNAKRTPASAVGRSPVDGRSGTQLPKIEGFELLEVLGAGGMGIVYKARHVALKRLVALKMIRLGTHASSEEIARFRGEAEASAQLHHPNIVQIYEVGEASGQPYFALEYVGGGSLSGLLGGNPQPPRLAAELVEKSARAMQHAHDRGILHRDLKPANILLAEPTDQSSAASARPSTASDTRSLGLSASGSDLRSLRVIPKIADFGLAKRLQTDSGQTQTGTVLGTPSYMSPEQALGTTTSSSDGKGIGPATDIYALGAILYEMLTGRPPFRGPSALDTLHQVCANEPVPPSELQPKLPRDLETICLRCLAKSPAQRYASAEALADDLRRYLEGRPIVARPTGRAERIVRWCRRNPVVAGLVGAVAAALFLGFAVSAVLALYALSKASQAEREKKTAQSAQQEADSNARRADENASRADRKASEAKDNEDRAQRNATEAKDQKERAQKEAYRNAWAAYGGQIALSLREWQDDNPKSAMEQLRATRWDFRHFEFRYLYTTFFHRNQQASFPDLVSPVLSGDGKRLAAQHKNGGFKVLETDTGREILSGTSDKERVSRLAMAADGKRLVTVTHVNGIENATLHIWNVDEKREERLLKNFSGQIAAIAVSGDGKRVMTSQETRVGSGQNAELKIWDADNGDLVAEIPSETLHAPYLALDAAGKRVACGGEALIRVFDVATMKLVLRVSDIKQIFGLEGSIALSADGKRLAGCVDEVVKVWDIDSGKEALTIDDHTQFADAVTFTADGKRLVTASADATVKVWDAVTGRKLFSLKGHEGQVMSLSVSADGKRIASGSPGAMNKDALRIWDASEPPGNLTIKAHSIPVHRFAMSADGSKFVTLGVDAGILHTKERLPPELKVWNTKTHREVQTISAVPNIPTCVALSPDGKRIIFAGVSAPDVGEFRVLDADSGQEVWKAADMKGSPMCAAVSPDGKLVAAGINRKHPSDQAQLLGQVKVWLLENGNERRAIDTSGVMQIAWFPDGKRLATAHFPDDRVRVWDLQTGVEVQLGKRTILGSYALAVSPDGRHIATSDQQKNLKLWSAETGDEELAIAGSFLILGGLTFSHDGKRLIAGAERSVKMWDTETGQQTIALDGHRGNIYGVAITPDGQQIFSASQDRTVIVWDASLDEDSPTRTAHTFSVQALGLSEDGQRIVTCDASTNSIKLWDRKSGEVRLSLRMSSGLPSCAAISRDGKRIAAGSIPLDKGKPGEIVVWDVESGQPIFATTAHTGGVRCLVLDKDGKRLISGGNDNAIRVWDVDAQKEVRTLTGHSGIVHSLALSSDGNRLVSGSGDMTARIWDLTTSKDPLTVSGFKEYVRFVTFSSDDKYIVSASSTVITLSDAITGKPAATLVGADPTDPFFGPVTAIACSADGKLLISGTYNGTLKIWDAATAKELAVFKEPEGVLALAFTPDGSHVVAGLGHGTLKVLDLSTHLRR